MVISSQVPGAGRKNVPEDISQELTTFDALTTDEKLGLLWVLYDNMGGSVTPAAPGAAEAQFTQSLFEQVKEMEQTAQMAFMRDLVEHKGTEQTEVYSSFSNDNKLLFWYQLAEGMAAGSVIPVPDDYKLSSAASKVFSDITALAFNEQITLLRYAVVDMGV
ncbi:MAG: orange carotenoid protein N-terminal domain-containing protein [Cyanobacteria bacterium J06649_4]